MSKFVITNLKVMIEIIHNARCSKSRNCFQIVEASGEEFKIREYLKDPLTEEELKNIVEKLGMPACELIRKNEMEFKEHFQGKNMSEQDCIDAMLAYPKLIQRPIIIKGNKAIIGRPESEVEKLLNR